MTQQVAVRGTWGREGGAVRNTRTLVPGQMSQKMSPLGVRATGRESRPVVQRVQNAGSPVTRWDGPGAPATPPVCRGRADMFVLAGGDVTGLATRSERAQGGDRVLQRGGYLSLVASLRGILVNEHLADGIVRSWGFSGSCGKCPRCNENGVS